MESQLHEERQARLAALPAEFGYSELTAFIQALRAAVALSSPETAKPSRKPASAPAPRPVPPSVVDQTATVGATPAVGVAPVPASTYAATPPPLGIGFARSAQQQAATAATAPVAGPVVAAGPSVRALPTAPVAVAPKPETPRLPSGTSLDDPANFGQMPDFTLLERGALEVSVHRTQLADALRFATKVLHTSKVPAAVWREWRQFERQVMEAMRVA